MWRIVDETIFRIRGPIHFSILPQQKLSCNHERNSNPSPIVDVQHTVLRIQNLIPRVTNRAQCVRITRDLRKIRERIAPIGNCAPTSGITVIGRDYRKRTHTVPVTAVHTAVVAVPAVVQI